MPPSLGSQALSPDHGERVTVRQSSVSRWLRRGAACILAASSISSTQIMAQVPMHSRVSDALLNIAIGGVTGAVTAVMHRTSVLTGLRRGSVGGLAMAAGKQFVDLRFHGAGFVGREISGAGISLVVAGGDSVIEYLLPVGPATIVILPNHRLDWRLNVSESISTIGLMISPNTRLDLSRSLYTGAPVYRDRRWHFGESGKLEAAGAEGLGTIRLAPEALGPSRRARDVVLAHETIHVLQEDFVNDAIGLPIERELLGQTQLGRRFTRHLDVGLLIPVSVQVIFPAISYEHRPWEQEAFSLTGTKMP